MSPFILIGSGCLICLLPLALYLLFLSWVNQRPYPTLVSGAWDFTMLLLGLSGFILVSGPLILSLVDSAWRSWILSGKLAGQRNEILFWSMTGSLWLLFQIGGIALLLRQRQPYTIVYHFAPKRAEEFLTLTLERLNLPWRKLVGGYQIAAEKPVEGQTRDPFSGDSIFLTMEGFELMQNLSLNWSQSETPVRREIEAEMEKLLEQVPGPINPFAGWMMTASFGIFFALFLGMGMLVWITFR